MSRKLKKIISIIIAVYIIVLIAYFFGWFILNQYGLEYRSSLQQFRIFWTCILPFPIGILLVYYYFIKQNERSEQKKFHISWVITPVLYLFLSVFFLSMMALGGFLDADQEEMLETGYLKVYDQNFPDASWYYCSPTSVFVREPLTYSSENTNYQYEPQEDTNTDLFNQKN